MRTTQLYYLSVQPQDLDKARAIQASLLGTVTEGGYRQSKAG